MSHNDDDTQHADVDLEARQRPAEALDALEHKVLGARPEDRRQAYDATANSDAPAHEADLDQDDWVVGAESGHRAVSEPPS